MTGPAKAGPVEAADANDTTYPNDGTCPEAASADGAPPALGS